MSNPEEAERIRRGDVFSGSKAIVDPRFDPQPGDTSTGEAGGVDTVLARDGAFVVTSLYGRVSIEFWAGAARWTYVRPAAAPPAPPESAKPV